MKLIFSSAIRLRCIILCGLPAMEKWYVNDPETIDDLKHEIEDAIPAIEAQTQVNENLLENCTKDRTM